jgi:sugar phosphate isomerase/epimerase
MAWIKDKVQINIPFHMLWDSYIDRFVELGLNPEIGFDANAFVKFGRPDFNMMAERLHQRFLTITLHAPFIDLCAGSPDPDIRAITRWRFEQVLEVVPIFKPKTVVCHLGYDLKRYKSFRDEWIENSLKTLKALRPNPPLITLEPHTEGDLWPSLDYLEKIWSW